MSMNNLQRFINSAPSVLHLGYHSKNLNSIQTFTNPTNHTWDQTKLTLSYRSSDQLSLFCSFRDMQLSLWTGLPSLPRCLQQELHHSGVLWEALCRGAWGTTAVSPEHLPRPKLRAPSWCRILSRIPCTYVTEKWVIRSSSCTSNKEFSGELRILEPTGFSSSIIYWRLKAGYPRRWLCLASWTFRTSSHKMRIKLFP